MDLLDIKKKLEHLKDILFKDDGEQKKRYVAGQGGQREQVVAPDRPAEVKGKAEPGAAGILANPNQLSPVDPNKIKQIPAQESPDHDRTLASRASIPVSSKPEPEPEKAKSILETRPTGHIWKSGVWNSLDQLHQHHFMNSFKPHDRDIINEILASKERSGASPQDLVGHTKDLIAGKVKKLDQSKVATKATKAKGKPEITPEQISEAETKAKDALSTPTDISRIGLHKLTGSKKFIQERAAKGGKFYHKAFNADGQYSASQTAQAIHDWAHGKQLPSEVTESAAFQAVDPNFYKPTTTAPAKKPTTTKYVAGKGGLERTQGTTPSEPTQEFKPKTISLDD